MIIEGVEGLRANEGKHLGYAEGIIVDAARVAVWKQATGHEDLSYLALSLSNLFLPEIAEVQGFSMGVNYGTDAIRFLAPLKVGSLVRAGAELASVTEIAGGVQTCMRITVETDEPICVIDSLSRWYV